MDGVYNGSKGELSAGDPWQVTWKSTVTIAQQYQTQLISSLATYHCLFFL
jgi:hypothetical protein